MSDNKKYYYLKLKENFFDSDELKIMESMENGHLYSNLYLKLLCKSDYYDRTHRFIKLMESSYTDINTYISLICRFDLKFIVESLNTLKNLNLVKITDEAILIKDINIDEDRDRSTNQYREWREAVFKRDNYTCLLCGERGGKLNAHHKKEWAKYKDERFNINNGVTLCEKCHKKIHRFKRRKKVIANAAN